MEMKYQSFRLLVIIIFTFGNSIILVCQALVLQKNELWMQRTNLPKFRIPERDRAFLGQDITVDRIHQWSGPRKSFGCIFEVEDKSPYRLFSVPVPHSKTGSEDVRVRVRELTHDEGGYGAKVWIAALCMTSWMGENADLFEGKSIMELGSGCGLPGIMAAKLGASKVTLSDFGTSNKRQQQKRNKDTIFIPPLDLLDNLEYNIALNQVEEVAEVLNLDWMECLKKDYRSEKYDAVLACACIYNKSDYKALAAAITKHLKKDGKLYMLHQKIRKDRGLIELIEELKKDKEIRESYFIFDSPPLFEGEPLLMHEFVPT